MIRKHEPREDESLTIAIVGGGIMGRGISLALATAGHRASLVESDAAVADSIPALLEADARANLDMDAETRNAVLARVTVTADFDAAVASARLVIEAVPERMDIKEPLWVRLGQVCGPETVLATNTSALDVDALAAQVPHPERVLGTHWFNPAQVVPCVEVVRGSNTSSAVIDFVVELLTRAGKLPIVVKNSPGFVANRIQFALVREALLCWQEGLASAEDIDAIVSSSFGMRLAALGPLTNADLGGLDTYRSILDFLSTHLGDRFAVPAVLDELVNGGRLGVKTGNGISEYDESEARDLMAFRDKALRRVISALGGVDRLTHPVEDACCD